MAKAIFFYEKTFILCCVDGIIFLKQLSLFNLYIREGYMHHLEVKDQYTSELIVEHTHTAAAFGSGDILVFSTPMMIGLMENAALKCAELKLDEGFSTVGTMVNIKHMAATPVGQCVKATAVLIEISDKKLVFEVSAYDEVEKIGEGTHERFIIQKEKFLARVQAKGSR